MVVNFALDFLSAGIGYMVAVFTPAIAREIKSWFVAIATKISADVKTVEADVKKL